jgi:hypothetical protein
MTAMAGSTQILASVAVVTVAAAVMLGRPRRLKPNCAAVAATAPRSLPPVRAPSPARQLDRAASILAAAALTDSAIEHYRGSFHNKAMYLPLGVGALMLAASLVAAAEDRPHAPVGGGAVSRLALATGMIGTGFHLYNITKRPGGVSWLNLFYAAPLGAPAALSLAGLMALMAERLRRDRVSARLLVGLVCAGIAGTSAEAGLMHFRGAFHNPAMVIPVTVPPIAAVLLAQAAVMPQGRHPAARWSLPSALSDRHFMPMGFSAAWAAGATGRRICSTGRRCRRPRPSRRSPLPGLSHFTSLRNPNHERTLSRL